MTDQTKTGDVISGNKKIAESPFSEPHIGGIPDYHSRWEMLMPVVEKLHNETTDDEREFAGLSIFELGICSDIQTVYEAVIEAVDWHQENS